MEVITLDQCDSTNNYVKTHLEELQDKFPVLVTSALQTGGRGRHQRHWVSPKGKGLYSSFGFSLDNNTNLNFLSLTAGISVIETLRKVTGLEFGLKWPNDILYRGKKIAGILIENIIADTRLISITGIGINLNHTADDFPDELRDKAVSLKMISGLDYRAQEINPLLSSIFFQWLETLKNNGSREIIETANRLSAFLRDNAISFHQPPGNNIVNGIFKGINRDGGLILQGKDGTPTLYYSGEII